MANIIASYNANLFRPAVLRKVTQNTIDAIRELKKTLKFDAIAFRGSSGAALAFAVSSELGIHLIHVRKDSGHSPHPVEGCYSAKRYIILDDFIDTGKTISEIVSKIDIHYFYEGRAAPKLVGIVLYNAVSRYKPHYIRRLSGLEFGELVIVSHGRK